jgi:biotin carboxyl carrier protein
MSRLSIIVDGFAFDVEVDWLPNGDRQVTVMVDGAPVHVISPDAFANTGEMEWFIVNDRPYEVMIDPDREWVRSPWGIHSLEIEDQEISVPRPATGDGRLKAPIPGQITQVMVAPGAAVEVGQPLLVLEAMKMENEIRAPRAGRVAAIRVTPGQRVLLDEVLIEIE